LILALLASAAGGAILALATARVLGRRGRAPAGAGGPGVRRAAPIAVAPPSDEAPAREPLRRALERLTEQVGARRALLWDVDGEHGLARASAVTSGDRPPEIGLQGDPLGWALEQQIPLRLTHSQRWTRGGNGCAIPLRRDGAAALVTLEFAVEADMPDPEALGLWGGWLDAFVRAETYQAQAAQDRQARDELLEVLRRLTEAKDEEKFAGELVEAARYLAAVDGAALARWTGEHGELLAYCGEGAAPPPSGRFRMAESVLGLVPHARNRVLRDRRREEAKRLPVLAPGERWAVDPRAAAAFPLMDEHENIVAILGIWSVADNALDPRSIEAVDTIVTYAALYLRQLLAYGAAKQESRRDALTGLPNRRFLEERLAEEAARCARYGRPLAVVMVDIDHFKLVNDTHGHDAGDAVLRALGSLLASSLRETDLPARLGGEEFLLLLPETTLRAAAETAERLRVRLQAAEIPWRGGSIPVTASFGISAVPDCVPIAASLLESADAALYAAKNGGRNRVSVAAARPGRP
jgi:diguanylate cyclase (GGDEF)-like protein